MTIATPIPPPPDKPETPLKCAVRFFYDLQKLRIQSGNRDNPKVDAALDTDDQAFLTATSLGLEALEKRCLKEVKRLLKPYPIWAWLKEQKGCGPTMAGVLISEIDITRAGTVSALWSYCGLAVDTQTGKAVRRTKGQKSNWNPFLKTKVVHVLGGCLIKANSPWRKFYDDYKHRKQLAGWGVSDGHRHNAAMRYMIKMFLAEMWTEWRRLEGLAVTEPYSAAKLGIRHGEHASMT